MTLLQQLFRGLPFGHFHAAFGIDVHASQAERVEHRLNLFGRYRSVRLGSRRVERRKLLLRQRRARQFRAP